MMKGMSIEERNAINNQYNAHKKSVLVGYILLIIGGWAGIHKVYLEEYKKAEVYVVLSISSIILFLVSTITTILFGYNITLNRVDDSNLFITVIIAGCGFIISLILLIKLIGDFIKYAKDVQVYNDNLLYDAITDITNRQIENVDDSTDYYTDIQNNHTNLE